MPTVAAGARAREGDRLTQVEGDLDRGAAVLGRQRSERVAPLVEREGVREHAGEVDSPVAHEVERIDTDDVAMTRYLEILRALLEVRGSTLAVGPLIERFDGGPDGRSRTSQARVHPVPMAVAAELFALNLETWRHEPFVEDNHSSDELDDLDAALRELARRPGRAEITWTMRQATFERTG